MGEGASKRRKIEAVSLAISMVCLLLICQDGIGRRGEPKSILGRAGSLTA